MRPTSELRGAAAIGRRPPCVPESADLLHPAAVEALVCEHHVADAQPEHFSLRLLIQPELQLGEAAGVVPVQLQLLDARLGDEELVGRQPRGRGDNLSGSVGQGEEPAKDEDAAAPLPLGYQAGEGQVVLLRYHDNGPRNHRHVQSLTYFCGQGTNRVSDINLLTSVHFVSLTA